MRFIKARHIRVRDTVLFSDDDVAEIPVVVLSITKEKEGQGLLFRCRFSNRGKKGLDSARSRPQARCLLIRRPRRK